ncbi:TIGR00153 family protein [Legionella anisa]|uniref:TIGR00153 family protein n=1 Tax=Legionella anisa TaxID=28082 RepID=A0AAX0WS94_9GAMM|nr:TIGR00153 family protein [Legionella anisa]AWN75343.1 TIGR00153 family protein [Legionella anisa]KTC72706.1 putative phosphate transport regulator [Legionella anisa]MCW8424485.1 TIGR00153 family protein [Legionella anisa]MCW8446397.1 TIGR00153 family protein [Legionella anisa]PNL60753.1 TIGR00153 family protein [Legionella anisa]
MGSIFNIFGPSPIRPIEQHMRKVHQCAKQLYPFFEVVLKKDWTNANKIAEKIISLKKEADLIKRDLRLHLPTGLFLPVSRTDLLEVLSAQNLIAKKTKGIVKLITSRQMIIPESLVPVFMPFLSRCLDASKQACKAINELDELLEAGFRGSEVKIVEEMIVTLSEIEHDSDERLADIRHRIFEIEKDLPAIDAIFLYELVQLIDDLADSAQRVGNLLQILIAR